MRATSPASAPAQSTTRRARIGAAPVAARKPSRSRSSPRSSVRRSSLAPCRWAARAKAGVAMSGLALPSIGQKAPPIIPSAT